MQWQSWRANPRRSNEMTPKEMYEALDSAGVDYEVVEIFEGVRIVRIFVEELTEGELK